MPEVCLDRIPVRRLEENSSETAQLARKNLGQAYNRNETVHFCGILGDKNHTAVFLPRNMSSSITGSPVEAARLSMRVLERYGRETPGRSGEMSGELESVSILPLISDLTNDFMAFGLYSERSRYRSRDSGKPDWKRTVSRDIPFISNSGVPVYVSPRTTRLQDCHDHPLTRIQAKVLLEIEARHGWWLGPEFVSACSVLPSIPDPIGPRHVWPNDLMAALTGLYANRPMGLAKQLLGYLQQDFSTGEGEFLAGISDFEWVWEEMLRQTLTGVEPGWNERLPKPAYLDSSGSVQAFSKGMEVDMVVRNATGYMVLDAKYYGASSLSTVPRTGDIVKQLMYENAVRVVLKDAGVVTDVSNAFVFPSSTQHSRPFVSAGLSSGKGLDGRFPTIGIIYQDIEKVMQAYVGRYKIDL